MSINIKDKENLEIDMFLEAVLRSCGYDFKNYARASLKRRLKHRLAEEKLNNISEMIPLALYDKNFVNRFLVDMSITVTEMFRDPAFYAAFREVVVPQLRTYPFLKIWHAGCATGEEVYSMAILLEEEGLLDRTQIYATDFNSKALEIAKEGIYPIKEVQNNSRNYQKSNGSQTFADYFVTKYNNIKLNTDLMRNTAFAHHNLVIDGVFGEMNVVICRNVLIYFDHELQNRVLNKFSESLCHRGYLCLGTKESIQFSDLKNDFDTIDQRQRIFRKQQ